MYILGVSGLYHDSAAALICDGEIIAAAQEERFTRVKHDARIPVNAMRYCLEQAGITSEDLETVVYYDQPLLTLDRFLKNALALGEGAGNLVERTYPNLFSWKLWIHKQIEAAIGSLGKQGKLLVTKHHISHAASAFYPSPYEKAVVLTIDGVGEWTTTAIGVGDRNNLTLYEEIKYPHSIGLLYSAFTYFCGFKVNSGDYKFMGLAPYGKPVYYDVIKEKMIDIKKDGSYRLNLDFFDYYKGGTMINEGRFSELFGGGRRQPESRITQREMDIAASVQKITEEMILLLARHAKEKYGEGVDNLCIAGGVALNCVANGKLQKAGIFKNIWIQPAAGDAGGALGAALYVYYAYYRKERIPEAQDSQKGSLLGPTFSTGEIRRYLEEHQCPYHQYEDRKEKAVLLAKLLSEEKIIGVAQGRMEFGPRALGNRSILADCRSPYMQSRINLKIKYRESFRPFAPLVLAEKEAEYFDLPCDSPYMLKVGDVQPNRRKPFDLDGLLSDRDGDMLQVVSEPRSDIPAVTHVDYSARIQTVDQERNPELHGILSEYEKLTGCAVLVNTSFNVRGEPIVCTPKDSYECFMRTDMDVLVLEDLVLYKEEQPEFVETEDWREKYALD
ncbi:MAG: carbamoyltransferase [Lachnospiraceae bacterium]|jgi:carbamoyltransferase|nr:carbamoyltransferase [Lachnospiraceae bacterium]